MHVMRFASYVIAAALPLAATGTAMAQSNPPGSPTAAVLDGVTKNQWLAAGFVGSSFGTRVENVNADTNAKLDFGGQLGFLWKGVIGIEGLADFSPSMNIARAQLLDEPRLTSYMANAIGALPLGSRGQILPYVSGGFGVIRMRADVLNLLTVQPASGEVPVVIAANGSTTITDGQLGGNIGAGLMGFAGDHFGFRTDVRFYRGMSDNTPQDDSLTRTILSNLEFWRANVGLAVRW
jgi:hypothetical protein